jgi:hypothetical protein
MKRPLIFIITLFASSAVFADQSTGYVCTSIDSDTGACLKWQEISIPENERGKKGSGHYSYENDYRRPEPNKRPPLFKAVPTGSAFMPSSEYAPGIPKVGEK